MFDLAFAFLAFLKNMNFHIFLFLWQVFVFKGSVNMHIFFLLIFPDRVSTRHDAVAELDRMAGRKTPSFSQSVESSSNEDGTDNSSLKS